MKKQILLLLLISFPFSNSFGQTIINTESLLKEIDSTFAFKLNIEGNVNFGNIEFGQLNNSLSIGKKINNSLLRLSFGYEYISEDKEVLADDWVGQIRLNKFYKKNSAFIFVQGQNVKSLKLIHRYLMGAGYRIRIKEKQTNYFDFSLGLFYEDELYEAENLSQIEKYNYRYSLSSFSNFSITEKILLNTSIYYQINTEDLNDRRLFIEPRLYFDFTSFPIYLNLKYRYHSKPYVEILKSDTELTFGIEIDF